EGQNLQGIARAMEYGFGIGAGVGTVAGAVGGALEARSADQLRQRIATLLRSRVQAPPASLADDILVNGTLDKLRQVPTAGSNQQVLQHTPAVWQALHDPDAIASAVSEVWLEEHLLGVMAPRAAEQRYGQAAAVLAHRRGAPVVILP